MSHRGLKFPLQSPVDDEILSTSIKTNRSGTDIQGRLGRSERNNAVPDGRDVLDQMNDSDKEEGYLASHNSSPRKRARPGLNIVTNLKQFSNRSLTDPQVATQIDENRHKLATRAITAKDVAQLSKASTDGVVPTFVNLTDIRNLSRNDETVFHKICSDQKRGSFPQESTVTTTAGVSRKLQTAIQPTPPLGPPTPPDWQGRSGYNDSLRGPEKQNTDGPVGEISPSTRTIVIGLDEGRMQDHIMPSQYGGRNITRQLSQKTPATPSILITPADETASWDYLSDESDMTRPRRPTSSIYSQSTSFAKPFTMPADAPPVPPIPSSHWESKHGVSRPAAERDSLEPWGHEDSPTEPKDLDSVASDDSERRILNGTFSKAVVNARPHSKGWWNLLTPIMSRSNTLASKKTVVVEDAKPPLPNSPRSHRVSILEKDLKEETSPDTPRRNGIGNDQVSTWSRWSDWERDREFADAVSSAGLTPSVDRSPSNPQLRLAENSSPVSPPIVAGTAAEYFLACAHDNISPIPYFECENHSCKEKLPLLISRFDRDPVIPIEAERDLTEEDIGKPLDAIASPSSKSTSEAMQSKSEEPQVPKENRGRSDSDSTMIDDESEDEPESVKGPQAPQVAASSSRSPFVTDNPTPRSKSEGVPLDPVQGNIIQDTEEVESYVAPKSSSRVRYPAENPMPRPKSIEMPMQPGLGPTVADAEDSIGIPPESPQRRITRFPPYSPTTKRRHEPFSPGPLSPAAEKVLGPSNGTAMSEWPTSSEPPFVTDDYSKHLPPRPNVVPLPISRDDYSEEEQAMDFEHKFSEEKRPEIGKDLKGKRGNQRASSRFLGSSTPGGKRKLILCVLISLGLLSVVVVSVVLATTLTRKGDDTPVQLQWLNLTGFPAMPTGIATIAQPDAVEEDSGCVNSSAVWSCALPAEMQNTLTSGDPDQPNFRLEIRFRNGTVANGTELATNSTMKRSVSRDNLDTSPSALRHRDLFEDDLYSASPSPPSLAEQEFLGNTTDNISIPFAGEKTPFFITFLSPIALTQSSSTLRRREDQNDTGISNSKLAALKHYIPDPSVDSNGTSAPANLLPYPVSQPVRLYNRGLSTEHYGFYTYFDRSIFLSSGSLNVSSASNSSSSSQSGGVPETEAGLRCTWSQTRFRVQIWTNLGSDVTLLSPLNVSANSSQTNSTLSSADQLSRPGSFPYPVSITLDRHGGVYKKKMIYCYDLNGVQKPVKNSAQLVEEFRAAGGSAINPAPGDLSLTGDDNDSDYDASAGGVDGGTGGCACRWTNFQ